MSFLSPVNQARWARFRHNRRGYLSLWLFMLLFLCSLGAELIANDRPLLVQYRGSLYVPALKNYSETTFGGPFATAADYQDPWLQKQLDDNGWVLWAPIRFGATTIDFATQTPFPSPPSTRNWLIRLMLRIRRIWLVNRLRHVLSYRFSPCLWRCGSSCCSQRVGNAVTI